ncbi:MAG: hypothetical protein Unbinned400contig1004_27 [Prokaryotic dsDNA virus sp.]|nr:MAG: hypothetical protein Unbinned400contig1004_27 [Prokaryotic dsDNA virus sp.]|tara:strand:- start:23028 stop:23426 length:399 start_codon:yes stop_codon:yes gene_type:complete
MSLDNSINGGHSEESHVKPRESGETFEKPRRNSKGQWLKGSSGNPSALFKKGNTYSVGKGRRNSVSDLLKNMGDVKKEGHSKSRMETVLNRLYELAESGDIRAIQELLSRIWGKSPETIRTQEIEADELIIS